MPKTTEQSIYDRLSAIPQVGLAAVKELLWTDLNYDYANAPISARSWPEGTQNLLAGDPLLLAQHGDFHVIHTPLAAGLTVTAERQVVTHLLPNHPYALFLFSDPGEQQWHIVNVKLGRTEESAGAPAVAQRILRRIAVGPGEQLRTAAERLALLDIAAIVEAVGQPLPLSPLVIQEQHDRAFDVEAVTKGFFADYERIFRQTEARIAGLSADDEDVRRMFTQQFFNRLLFIMFVERKGWLSFSQPETGQKRADYLRALWEAHTADVASAGSQSGGANFYRDRLKVLFFAGLNNPGSVDYLTPFPKGFVQQYIGDVPYLNGGLFEKDALDEREDVLAPDAVFPTILNDLLYHYNFTVTESTPLDVEVAVDPEMLGKIFEKLVTGRHESGSYYTPKPEVAFMCREALKGYLRDTCPREIPEAIAAFVDGRDPSGFRAPERALEALKRVRVCDLACGSGAYLLGMLHELLELRQALFAAHRLDPRSTYDRKLEIIQHNLYGVDIDPFAVNIARLRLWLSLIVDFAGEKPLPLPNLDFKIEVGDSLTAPAPGELQPDLFRYRQVEDYFRCKAQYMTAHGWEKRDLKARIAGLQTEIAQWASERGQEGFDWAVQFAEVFTPQQDADTVTGQMSHLVNATPGQMQLTTSAAPGFDIIVANPPYVRQELLGSAYKATLKKRYPEVYTGTADLYVYFYARALHLLRQGGVASFITSNKWLRAGYGEGLRKHLNATATVHAIIDFGDLPLFEAIAYPQIIVFQKSAPPEGHTLRALTVGDLSAVERLSEVVQAEAWEQPRSSLRADGWALVRPVVLELMRKLRKSGHSLGEYVGGRFYRGIVTGLNEAFVVDAMIAEKLSLLNPKYSQVLRPWLRGRDLGRWRTSKCQVYLLYIPWDFNIKDYPEVEEYLLRYYDKLSQRPEVREGRYPWFALSRYASQYVDDFSKPKIIYPHFNTSPNFALEDQGAFSNDKTYIIPDGSLYLLGILNSTVVDFFLHQVCPSVQKGYMEFRTIYIEQIPIADPPPDQRAAIEGLVRHLLDARGQGPQVAAWEAELNALVYQVYGLTAEEIRVVEGEHHG